MRTIQVVVDEPLIEAADKVAQEEGLNRSALIREALRAYLVQAKRRELEKRDREGYLRFPDTEDDLQGWEQEAAWPDN
jgi:metal-responsive CopG/Arc/MetJ family transcriptional regulator